MHRKVTLDQVKRELRARACRSCPLRGAARPDDRIDTERALDCEATCDLFIHLPKLQQVARQLDPIVSSYDMALRHKINQIVESIARSRSGGSRSSPLKRYRECVIQTLSELADQ